MRTSTSVPRDGYTDAARRGECCAPWCSPGCCQHGWPGTDLWRPRQPWPVCSMQAAQLPMERVLARGHCCRAAAGRAGRPGGGGRTLKTSWSRETCASMASSESKQMAGPSYTRPSLPVILPAQRHGRRGRGRSAQRRLLLGGCMLGQRTVAAPDAGGQAGTLLAGTAGRVHGRPGVGGLRQAR